MDDPIAYRRHEIEWTPEKVGRFWDHWSGRDPDTYFGQVVGDSLLSLVWRMVGQIPEPILDFGCGPGYLLSKLLRHRKRCAGVDFSAESIQSLREKHGHDECLLSVEKISTIPTQLAADSFATVLFIETIEHLLPHDVHATLKELFRVTAPGGYLVVTTPNDEDLERLKVTCPDCGCRFHRMQHTTQWTKETLNSFMVEVGFQQRFCDATRLAKRGMRGKVGQLARTYLLRQMPPHLVYIGQKVCRE